MDKKALCKMSRVMQTRVAVVDETVPRWMKVRLVHSTRGVTGP